MMDLLLELIDFVVVAIIIINATTSIIAPFVVKFLPERRY